MPAAEAEIAALAAEVARIQVRYQAAEAKRQADYWRFCRCANAPPVSAALMKEVCALEEQLAKARRALKVAQGVRNMQCSRCGEGYETDKPQDPEMEPGFGICAGCAAVTANLRAVHEPERTLAEHQERLAKYA